VQLNPADVETNIVIFDVAATAPSAPDLGRQLEAAGVRLSVLGRKKLRAVTHLDVSRADIQTAIDVLRRVLSS
jgi:threonine aldolase